MVVFAVDVGVGRSGAVGELVRHPRLAQKEHLLMNLAACLVCLSSTFLQHQLTPVPDPVSEPVRVEGTLIPGCAVAAAWSLLLSEGKDVTLAELTQRFREMNPAYDRTRVSMLELR